MSPTPIPRWQGVALLLGIATTFGANHVAARLAFDHGTNVLTAVTVRSIGTGLAVLAMLLAAGVPFALAHTTRMRALMIGLLLCIQSVCLYAAVARIPVALALLVFNTYPLVLALISWLAGAERPSRRTLVIMPVALAGLTLALDAGGWSRGGAGDLAGRWQEIGPGVGFGVAAGVSFALALFLTTRWLQGVDARMRSLLAMTVIAVLAGGAGLVTDGFVLPRDATGWVGLALLTALYGIAITTLFAVLPRLGAVNNVALMNFEPVAALFLAWAFLDQTVTSLQLVGAAIVIAAIIALAAGRR